jgi:predicted permease
MTTLFNDIKYTIRQLTKNPGFALITVLTLALGIGANAAIFGLLNSVMFQSLPVRNPHELHGIHWVGDITPEIWGRVVGAPNGEQTSNTFTYPAYCKFRDNCTGVAEVFAFFELGPSNSSTAVIRGQASRVNALLVSGNFFQSLGLKPVRGRIIMPEHDQPNVPPVTVISYGAWKKHFGGDPDVIGQKIVLDQVSATVIGILPEGFHGMEKGCRSDFYLPLSLQPQIKGICPLKSTDLWWVQVMARLKPSVDELEVSRLLGTLFARATGESGIDASKRNLRIVLTEGCRGLGGALAPRLGVMAKPLYLLFGLVGIVLLVTCINIAGLLLGRGATRYHEFAVRVALGAGRRHLIRQLLTESAVLAVLGGCGGFLLATWMKPALSRILWTSETTLDVRSDIHVYGFMLVIVVVTSILFGLLPALRTARIEPASNLKHRTLLGKPRLALNKMLISLQVGLSLLLLVGAGLFTMTLINIGRVEAGFDTENLLVFRADIGKRQVDFCTAIGALPGVQGVTYSNLPLLTGARSNTGVPMPHNRSETLPVLRLNVSETFLQTMGIPLLAGRDFRTLDTEGSQEVIIVNQALAQAAFPDDTAIGEFLTIHQQDYRIVGLCGDTKYYDLKMPCEPTVFFPSREGTFYALRAAANPQDLIPAIRQALSVINPGTALSDVKTLKAQISENTRQERSFAWLASSLAFLAVLQSCIGLYGLMANDVTRRTSEIGIRMALGAKPAAVAWPILREALLLTLIGATVGVPLVLALSRFIKSQLYGVASYDPPTLVVGVLILIGVAISAAWLPARRAARIDPMEALRYE